MALGKRVVSGYFPSTMNEAAQTWDFLKADGPKLFITLAVTVDQTEKKSTSCESEESDKLNLSSSLYWLSLRRTLVLIYCSITFCFNVMTHELTYEHYNRSNQSITKLSRIKILRFRFF